MLPAEPYAMKVTANKDGSGTRLADIVLADSLLVDFGCVVGDRAEYRSVDDVIQLAYVQRDGDQLIIAFSSSAHGLYGLELCFSRNVNSPEYYVSQSETDLSNPFPYCETPDPRWYGFLATGQLQSFADSIANGYYAIPIDAAYIEPTLIQNLSRVSVQSINIANRDRAHATVPSDCDSTSSSSSSSRTPVVFSLHTCMIGRIKFQEGYNCRIRQNDRTNTIEIGASVGSGKGEPCEEIIITPADTSVSDQPLDKGLFCRDVVKTINGVGGQSITIVGGPGINVTDQPAAHRIVIDANLQELRVCSDNAADNP